MSRHVTVMSTLLSGLLLDSLIVLAAPAATTAVPAGSCLR